MTGSARGRAARPRLFAWLQKAWRPSARSGHGKIIFRSATLCVEHFSTWRRNRKIAFIFSPSLNRLLAGNPYGGELFLREGFDVISFKSNVDEWFQQTPQHVFSDIERFIAGKYSERVGYGASMGAYAAIAFSRLLHLDRVLALSPQYSISEPFDTRWAFYNKNIRWRYRIDRQAIEPRCEYVILYDDRDLDREQIARINDVIAESNRRAVAIRYAGHSVAHYLRETDLLKDVAVRFLRRQDPGALDLRSRRRRSKSYFQTLAAHFFRKGQSARALRAIDRAIALKPNDVGLYRFRCDALIRLERPDEAIASLEAMLSLAPFDANMLSHAAGVLAGLGRLENALDKIDRAIAVDASLPAYHRQRGVILMRLGRTEDALKPIRVALSLAGNDPALLTQMSSLLSQAGQLDEALRVIDRSIGLDAASAGAHRHRGSLLMRMGRAEEAIAAMNDALARAPGDPLLLSQMSGMLARTDRLDLALQAIDRAIAIDATKPALHRHRSSVLTRLGRFDEAIDAFRAVQLLAPDDAGAAAHLENLIAERARRQKS